MSINIRKLRPHLHKEITVPIGDSATGDLITIGYDADEYTVKLERELQEKIKENLPGAMLAVYVLKLVKSWDVVDYDPEDAKSDLPEEEWKTVPMPLTPDTFDDLIPIHLMARIVECIAEDQNPKLKSSERTRST